jgi:hypothetical protein
MHLLRFAYSQQVTDIKYAFVLRVFVFVCVCVCVCVRARERVRACMCVLACACVRVRAIDFFLTVSKTVFKIFST